MAANELKINFLACILRHGIEMEVEKGVADDHSNMLFCKIHTPAWLLAEHMAKYEVTKHFMDNHTWMMGRKGIGFKSENLFVSTYERELMKMIRRRYFRPINLSNRDRSYVTHMIISHLRFGRKETHYGLFRLIRNRIIIDAYALHDGPYFLPELQPTLNFNTRQVLFMTWAGYDSVFSSQPVNIINEYFGPKIGLFFAFYQYYIWMLFVMSLLSLAMLIPGWKVYRALLNGTFDNFYCRSNHVYLCPVCIDFIACPLRPLSDYCRFHEVVRVVQRFMTMSPVFSLWCILFYFFWRRRHNYYCWMWELKKTPEHPIARPEYQVGFRKAYRDKRTGFWERRHESIINMVLIYLVGPVVGCLSIYIAIFSVIEVHSKVIAQLKPNSSLWYDIMKQRKNETRRQMMQDRDYYALSYVVPFQIVIMAVLELAINNFLVPVLVSAENHKYVDSYQRSLAYNMFTYSLVFILPLSIFSYWIKGRFFEHPLLHWDTIMYVGSSKYNGVFLDAFFYYHCSHRNCIDESLIIFIMVMLFNMIMQVLRNMFRMFPHIGLMNLTDYNQSPDRIRNVPDWEREYRLRELKDETVQRWFNYLLVEMAIFMWFGTIFPQAAIGLFLLHFIFVRTIAKQLVTNYRRPMLYNVRGLQAVNRLIAFICLAAPVAHAFTNSRMDYFVKTEFHTTNFSKIPKAQAEYDLMAPEHKQPKCLYPAKWRDYDAWRDFVHFNWSWPLLQMNITYPGLNLVSTYSRYFTEMNQIVDILKYTHYFAIFILLCFVYIPPKSDNVKARQFKEEEIRRFAKTEEFILNDDDPYYGKYNNYCGW